MKRQPHTQTKPAPAPASRPAREPVAPFVRHSSPTVLPMSNGELRVIPGKLIVTDRADEIKTAEFAKLTGLSQRHVLQLCDEGKIAFRRRSPRTKSHYLIPRSEVERFLNLRGEA
jgi:excisionase family DNA binding protein